MCNIPFDSSQLLSTHHGGKLGIVTLNHADRSAHLPGQGMYVDTISQGEGGIGMP